MQCLFAAPSAVLAIVLASGCTGDATESPAPAPAGEIAAPAAGASPVASDWKAEQKRLALLGLAYQTGFVTVVPGDAALRVAGPDAEAAERALQRGAELLAKNDRLGAVSACTEAVLFAPESPSALAGLGDALLAEQMVHEAAAAYRTALRYAPESADLHLDLGDALWRVDQRPEAIAEALEATRLDPAFGRAHAKLAVWSWYAHDLPGAWREVHGAEALGESVPPQFRALLADAMPEPR